MRRTKLKEGEQTLHMSDPAPSVSGVILRHLAKVGLHKRPLKYARPEDRPSRKKERLSCAEDLRLIIPEWLALRAGLAPGMRVEVVVTEDGWTCLRPLAGQDAMRVTWEAERALARDAARRREEESFWRNLQLRVPYNEASRWVKRVRRRMERQRGIPRDFPNG